MKMTTKKILLFVPDGTGIKNYLYSDVFKNTTSSISLFHNFDNDTLSHIKKQLPFDSAIEIPAYKETVREKFLRELIHYSRLKYNAKKVENNTILDFGKKSHKSLKLNLFYATINFATQFYKSYKRILKLEGKYQEAIRQNVFYSKVSEILKQQKPDVVFCTHQRALKAPTIFAAANDLGIKTNTVIYSWDNLPKARLALRADTYLVWSQHMKDELHLFYPEIPLESIKVTGTPQFEFYNTSENIIPKQHFFEKYGISEEKKLICFSGDDIKTSPYDPQYLNDIATAIKKAGEENNYQLIFRRCPVDVSGRYDWVLEKFPELIVDMPPLWNFNSELWTAVYPTYEDVKVLVSLAYYTDIVINVGSTMAFDFGMFQKPCIFINYDQPESKNWSVKTIYNYQHFRSMPSKNAVYWLNNASEIMEVLQKATQSPETKIKEWFNIVVNHSESASEKIAKELN